jgi:2'-5' RNA ligase
MNNLHRIFIAVNLPEKLKKELSVLQDRWPELPARWTKTENLHTTIIFLGNTNDQEVFDICEIITQVAKRHEPFDLSLEKISYGPIKNLQVAGPFVEDEVRHNFKLPRMIWMTGEKSPELGRLQKDLESALYEFCGGEYRKGEDYGFAPHITLARLQQAGLAQMEAEEIPVIDEIMKRTFLVESIEVMESELKRGGPVYTILESLKLGE